MRSSPLPDVFAHPDLFQRILSYADNPTLAIMLRVNQTAQDTAALFLYRDLRVDFAMNSHPLIGAQIPLGRATTRGMTSAMHRNFKHRLLTDTKSIILYRHTSNLPLCRNHDDWATPLPNLQTLQLRGSQGLCL